MNKTTTLRDLVFTCEDSEEVEIAISLLIGRLNELKELPNETYYLGMLKNTKK